MCDHAGFLQQGVGLEKKNLQNITRDLQVELAENMFIKDGLRRGFWQGLLSKIKNKKNYGKKCSYAVWQVQLSSNRCCSS